MYFFCNTLHGLFMNAIVCHWLPNKLNCIQFANLTSFSCLCWSFWRLSLAFNCKTVELISFLSCYLHLMSSSNFKTVKSVKSSQITMQLWLLCHNKPLKIPRLKCLKMKTDWGFIPRSSIRLEILLNEQVRADSGCPINRSTPAYWGNVILRRMMVEDYKILRFQVWVLRWPVLSAYTVGKSQEQKNKATDETLIHGSPFPTHHKGLHGRMFCFSLEKSHLVHENVCWGQLNCDVWLCGYTCPQDFLSCTTICHLTHLFSQLFLLFSKANTLMLSANPGGGGCLTLKST